MNKKGIDFMREQRKRYTDFLSKNPNIKARIITTDLKERYMRMGEEVRVFKIDVRNTREMEEMAIATKMEDFVKRSKSN